MAKYHVNDKGEPGKCGALKGKCPFGGEKDHHENEAAARAAYEAKMRGDVFTVKKNRSAAEKPLSDIMDLELLQKMIKGRYVLVRAHPEDSSMKILSYGVETQFQAKWNDVTKAARGLIIKSEKEDFSDAVILERPWGKFFTLQQHDSGWGLGDEENNGGKSSESLMNSVDFDAPAEVLDKADGSLGILYRAPDGKLALSTKGAFDSEVAAHYTKKLRNNSAMYAAAEKLKGENPNTSFMFELTGPDNKIVVDYANEEIILLGAVSNESDIYHSPKEYADVWSGGDGMGIVEEMPAKSLRDALALPSDRENREGVVVRIISDDPAKQMQIKIKQDNYLSLHRTATVASPKNLRHVISSIEPSASDLIAVAKSGDIRKIKEINDLMAEIEGNKSSFAKNTLKKTQGYIEENLIKTAKEFDKAYEFIESGRHGVAITGNYGEDKKNFAKTLGKYREINKTMAFAIFDKVLQGEGAETVNTNRIMDTLARSIKDKKFK